MMKRPWINLLLLLAVGCTSVTPTALPAPSVPAPTPTLGSPSIRVTTPPDPAPVAQAFFEAWKLDDYAAMYAGLDAASQQAISVEDFTNRYLEAALEAAVPQGNVGFQVLAARVLNPQEAAVEYQVTLTSVLVGPLTRENEMRLGLEGGQWRIRWNETLILPDLTGGLKLRMVNYVPARGKIYDRNGNPLAAPGEGYALGLVPAEIDPELESKMLTLLSRASGYSAEYIYSLYGNLGLDYGFYVPFFTVPAEMLNPYYNALVGYTGVNVNFFSGRFYEGAAPQTIGYVSALQPEEVDRYRRLGYQWTERVGRTGLEQAMEQYLSGVHGGALYLDNPATQQSQKLGEGFITPGEDVYTTLDEALQLQAQNALFGFKGAAVVIERDTGRVLAMASAPYFDPNLFEPTNYNSLFTSPLFDPADPVFDRAIRGQYPLGSVFKIITISAALQSGDYTAASTYDCQHEFTELGSPILYDWTLADELPPSGLLTLPEGLMRSCNPWFYHLGLDFFDRGKTTVISTMARGFGLGQRTGIELPQEEAGQVPDPTERLDATNLAIGQGGLLVTPLQVATFVAAVGNGGTLYRPHLVEKITDFDGNPVFAFEPEIAGALPISPENLAIVQQAMHMVVRDKRGTAYRVMGAFPKDIAGKTGTAQLDGDVDPHSWYVVYTNANDPEKPDIAIAVVVENQGEGADYAAPIALRILETYFYGRPRTQFWWEQRIGVPRDLIPTEEPPQNDGGG